MNESVTGYLHSDYARSLAEFGEPRELPRSGGWILERVIPGTPYKDAMGCYPLFCCRDWSRLREDLDEIGTDLVSLVLVTDPFANLEIGDLQNSFNQVVPFKRHVIVDLSAPLERSVDKDHRYYVRKSLKEVCVEICEQPSVYLNDWYSLYQNLIHRHDIKGIQAFSFSSFQKQLQIPGTIMALGRLKSTNEIVGALSVMQYGLLGYAHLSSFSENGYKVNASYSIYWETLKYCIRQNIQWFDFGGVAGSTDNPNDGLAMFKRGWSKNIKMVYLCGRIFDERKYLAICEIKGIQPTTEYFPAYRFRDNK